MIRSPLKRAVRRAMQTETFRMVNRMRPHFAPASFLPPPGITRGATGNRNVAISAQNSPNYTPNDQKMIKMTNGVAVWNFNTRFKNPPRCKATPVGAYKNGMGTIVPQEIYLQGVGTPTGQIFHSTATDDNRYLHVHAAGDPD